MHAGIMSRKPWITQLSFLFLQSLEGWRLASPLLPDVSRAGWGGLSLELSVFDSGKGVGAIHAGGFAAGVQP